MKEVSGCLDGMDSCSNTALSVDNGCDRELELEKYAFIKKCISIAICTKNNNEDIGEYENGMLKPYKKMKEILEKLVNSKEYPTEQQEMLFLNMLELLFIAKKVSQEERNMRYKQLCLIKNINQNILNYITTR